ncbi:hypothetical protein [Rhizobium halophytocola]|uniref:Uncharacterized protein n=1 Tax=Rhizobium halophytocola TaxID=735519 RepID=A0ABS4E2E5_9HYPH|nr:hypothetical protein [Rhizobium halophytocola]MBP1852120.1 hypothetical protein [Rhizobium halophytocola]
MAKLTHLTADTAVEYTIRDGVTVINGAKVRPGAKTIRLTAKQAAYDLGLGRLALADKAPVKAVKADDGN